MPWGRNEDAPASVRRVLSEKALTIGRRAANRVWARGGKDEEAMVAFWSAVKSAGYSKDKDGKWRSEGQRIEREARKVLSAK